MQPVHSVEALDPPLFEGIVAHIPDAVIFADREGLIRVWNRGAQALFGFAAEEVLGRSLDVIVPERLRTAHWRGFQAALDARHTKHGNQVRTTRSIHKDGRTLYVELSFGLVSDAAGKVAGSVAVGRDCSERYQAEKARREQHAALEAARPAE